MKRRFAKTTNVVGNDLHQEEEFLAQANKTVVSHVFRNSEGSGFESILLSGSLSRNFPGGGGACFRNNCKHISFAVPSVFNDKLAHQTVLEQDVVNCSDIAHVDTGSLESVEEFDTQVERWKIASSGSRLTHDSGVHCNVVTKLFHVFQ
jgi:hypothetical protein